MFIGFDFGANIHFLINKNALEKQQNDVSIETVNYWF